jgi:hypothetical protein
MTHFRDKASNGLLIVTFLAWGAGASMTTDVSGGSPFYGSCDSLAIEAPKPMAQRIDIMPGQNLFKVGSRAFVSNYFANSFDVFATFSDNNLS